MSLRDDLQALVQDVGVHGPFVSLFMPVHPEDVTMEKDRAQFKSLVSQAQTEFGERFPDAEWRPYGEKFALILAERQLISGTNTSMAIIAGPDRVYQYFMRLPLNPEVSVYSPFMATMSLKWTCRTRRRLSALRPLARS
jgi:hypothetical protein